jgi:putative aldouronate transport system permease protein
VKYVRESYGDRFFGIVMYVLAALFSLSILSPVAYVFISSFAHEAEVLNRGYFLFPHDWTLNSYKYLLHNEQFMVSLLVTAIITFGGTIISLTLTTFMAYGISKRWLVGRRALSFMVIFTMMFNGGIIPTYMIVKSLGMINTLWSLMLPMAIIPFYLIVMRSFFQNIPEEIEESAVMDGCSDFRLLFSIVIPLSIPAIVTFGLFYAVHNLNTFFHAIMFITDHEKWPIQVVLRQMLIEDMNDLVDSSDTDFLYGQTVKMAGIVISTLPVLIVYPFLQKYFSQGMMLGAVKG